MRSPRAARLSLCALLALAPLMTHGAEALYVVEQLVVSVNGAADGSGERIATVKSGDRVELIERAGEAVHVRLADGREGWLRAIYLSGDEPLRPRLAQSEAETSRLRAEVARLSAAREAPGARAAAPAVPAAATGEESAGGPAGGLFALGTETPARSYWPLAALAGLLGLVLGFLLGWRALDRRIRAKYGGLRIY